MSIFTIFLLAFGLSMDAFAVSVSNPMCYPGITKKQSTLAALSFGVFQGAMPIIGFLAGSLFENIITNFDHWIALVLLGLIGGKMLLEGIKSIRQPETCPPEVKFTNKTIIVQAIATSIDALAVGISFTALQVNILWASTLIAGTTFVCCLFGAALGRKFGALLGDWAQILGGAILVGIGVKIFVEHMFF